MTLKDDLLRAGYFPEDLPPPFTTAPIAKFFRKHGSSSHLMDKKIPLRAATYNASKRGMTRRLFSAIHPVTAHDMAEFIAVRWPQLCDFFGRSNISLSTPEHRENGDRALSITTHPELEKRKLTRLSPYRFIATTDIARFYHSIYTHSIPWSYHGKAKAKSDRKDESTQNFFNKADAIIRNGQDGQTVGIPVGPDMSRAFAELIGTAIDLEFHSRLEGIDCTALRHVDDVWIGAHTHADAERALSRYREAIREFELDINENKTGIFSDTFSFADPQIHEITGQIEFSIDSQGTRAKARLQGALENTFAIAVKRKDDGILKYILSYIDHNKITDEHWDIAEPFLKRLAVHFGHTIDFIVRILIWRHFARSDLDIRRWRPILERILDHHGRLGNDSEVCWIIYAHQVLGLKIKQEIAERIIQNCGALSLVALLHAVVGRFSSRTLMAEALKRIEDEDDGGRFWPVFLEWKVNNWPQHKKLSLSIPTMEDLYANDTYIYEDTALPAVFHDVEEAGFADIMFAIERRLRNYNHPDANEE